MCYSLVTFVPFSFSSINVCHRFFCLVPQRVTSIHSPKCQNLHICNSFREIAVNSLTSN
ncbi:hypothetical protein RchiOBHm_Chr3g0487541 [Rosa chinensis]|uniref:Uncharacterized protein n=1 Tax=Rosa chinensis TaxID=74649 RepID=A0A2P6RFK5_ROSCH|nr:hypothetical protein RchiOBHm_Chr3g0487541 [Rosa chinensis]